MAILVGSSIEGKARREKPMACKPPIDEWAKTPVRATAPCQSARLRFPSLFTSRTHTAGAIFSPVSACGTIAPPLSFQFQDVPSQVGHDACHRTKHGSRRPRAH